jgi:polyhydroxyalkanoate synthesis regulator phasin
MKRVLAVLMAAVVILCMCSGCGSMSNQSGASSIAQVSSGADKEFMKDMKKALQARWDINDSKSTDDINKMSSDEQLAFMKSYVEAEKDILSKYSSADFNDVRLEKIATDYLSSLDGQLDSLKYYTTDYSKCITTWKEAYAKRVPLINELVNDYGLTVDSKYQTILDSVLNDAKSVKEKSDLETSIQSMINSANFEKSEKSSGNWAVYQATIENTSGATFSDFSFTINLLDSNGVIVESTYSNTVQNWNSGDKANFSFETNKAFNKIKLTATYNQK